MTARLFTAIGLMSGTSLDGIDAALIRTDGRNVVQTGTFLTVPYETDFRERLRSCLGERGPIADVERELTLKHAEVVRHLLAIEGLNASGVDLVGFHGHTILHAPERRYTRQIGDGALLARETGITVINDFRTADVQAGGQGAPLVPLYHQALATGLERPLAVLNLGGVGNVTWLGHNGEILAFDTGPGNALIDDWLLKKTGKAYDADGAVAAQGRVDQKALSKMLQSPHFHKPGPKSLDRDAFDPSPVQDLSVEDGAATLTAFTAATVEASLALLPEPPQRWLVTGGGRHNGTLMGMLAQRLNASVERVENVGWNGDALEAEAFAYLAVRSYLGLPLSVPGTTGVPAPVTGGKRHAVTEYSL